MSQSYGGKRTVAALAAGLLAGRRRDRPVGSFRHRAREQLNLVGKPRPFSADQRPLDEVVALL